MGKYLKFLVVAAITSASLIILGCEENANEQVNKPIASAETQKSDYVASSKITKSQEKFPAFAATDVNGNAVTDSIFKSKKITVVNIWGTFCPPCIGEMPELGEWADNMSEEAQLIGIVCDVDGASDNYTIETAKEILKKSNAKFLNIVPDESIMSYLENVEAVPTTIFVDSDGYILTKKVIGADVDEYKSVVGAYLNE